MNIFSILLAMLIGIAAGLPLGLALSFIILKILKKPWPFPQLFAQNWSNYLPFSKKASSVPEARVFTSAEPTELAGNYEHPPSESTPGQIGSNAVSWTANIPETELVQEIENNLSTARAPQQGALRAFRTKALDTEQSKVDSLHPKLKNIIEEAYKDMRLANTLVNLASGDSQMHQDIFLYNSYIGLCSNIAENLEQAMFSLVNSNA